jgi:hypothetical protein
LLLKLDLKKARDAKTPIGLATNIRNPDIKSPFQSRNTWEGKQAVPM